MRSSRLSNGIRVVSEAVNSFSSATIGIWLDRGSRQEAPENNGIAHFVEHMLFKGTRRRTAAQIAEEIDSVGGALNAFTGKEQTCFYARVLAEHLDLALDLLSDILLDPKFDAEELARERLVVLQEISQVEDTPDEYIHDLFASDYWPDHPLGLPVLGRSDYIAQLERQDCLKWIEQCRQPQHILIAAAGKVDHERLVEEVGKRFEGVSAATDGCRGRRAKPSQGVSLHFKDLEQVQLCFGTAGIASSDPDRYAASVLNAALGGGMSSRLFQEIREKRGWAYSVYSFLCSYSDSGYLGISVGTSAERVNEVVEAIVRELERVAQDGLKEEELRRMKDHIKGNILLSLESTESLMNRIARDQLTFGRMIPVSEVTRKLEEVSGEKVLEMAKLLVSKGSWALTLLGDMGDSKIDDRLVGIIGS